MTTRLVLRLPMQDIGERLSLCSLTGLMLDGGTDYFEFGEIIMIAKNVDRQDEPAAVLVSIELADGVELA